MEDGAFFFTQAYRLPAIGSLLTPYAGYWHLVPRAVAEIGTLLPAMGYGDAQIRDLEATIDAADADVVVSGTPIDLTRVLSVNKPMTRARYELREQQPGVLAEAVRKAIGG